MSNTTFSGPVASQNGFIPGSFTTAQRDALTNVATGTLIFNTTAGEAQVYDGSAWIAAFGGGGGGTTYTLDTDYVSPGLKFTNFGGPTELTISTPSWSNTAGANSIVAKPSGTAFTLVVSGNTGTFTMTASWTNLGAGGYSATGTWVGSGSFTSADVTSITVP